MLCKLITKHGKPGPQATVCSKRKEGHCLLEKEGKHESAFPLTTVYLKRKVGMSQLSHWLFWPQKGK